MILKEYLVFWLNLFQYAIRGSWKYYFWILFLTVLIIPGLWAYSEQLQHGLIVTNMTDQVSWGAYIANFTFLEGVATSAVFFVVPTFFYHYKSTKEIFLVAELLAVAAVIMCLLFIVVDVGRPDRSLHLLPYIGKLNFPKSVLAWDVVVLNGYLILNLHVASYILFMRYRNLTPKKWVYMPLAFISIFWAGSIHTVTAFLYSGLAGRPFWNSAIMAPRFLVSAFVVGPSILTLAFRFLNKFSNLKVEENVFELLKKIVSFTMPITMFLLGCEIFKEFYTDSTHVASAKYVFFGLDGAHMLVPYIWTAIFMNTFAMIVFVTPKLRDNKSLFIFSSILAIVGIWIEKAMGIIIPGFIPTPLGEIVEYRPSLHETLISVAIWSIGILIFSIFAKTSIGILNGDLNINSKKNKLT